jgi:hypothetical protein
MGIYSSIVAHVRDAQLSPPGIDRALGLSEADALEMALHDMTESFAKDFMDGRVGQQHNTFEHRSRVLRQLTAKLADMRTQEAVLVL